MNAPNVAALTLAAAFGAAFDDKFGSRAGLGKKPKKVYGPQLDFAAKVAPLAGRRFRHRITGQVRQFDVWDQHFGEDGAAEIVFAFSQYGGAWGWRCLPPTSPRKAWDWIQQADQLEAGASVRQIAGGAS